MPVLFTIGILLTCVTVDVSCCITTGVQYTLRMIDLYLDLDLQMQVVLSHFHLYHTTDLALKSNL